MRSLRGKWGGRERGTGNGERRPTPSPFLEEGEPETAEYGYRRRGWPCGVLALCGRLVIIGAVNLRLILRVAELE